MNLVEIGATPPLTPADVPPGHAGRVGRWHQSARAPDQNRKRPGARDALLAGGQDALAKLFRHCSSFRQAPISAPGDLIAQADSENPVYDWYPTTKWGAGEIVREDYSLDVPPGKTPTLLSVGMYTRDAAGAFHNLGVVDLPVNP